MDLLRFSSLLDAEVVAINCFVAMYKRRGMKYEVIGDDG